MDPEIELSFFTRLAELHRRSEKLTWQGSLREALTLCAELIGAPAAALLLLDEGNVILHRTSYGRPRLATLESLSEDEARAWLEQARARALCPRPLQEVTLWLLPIPPHSRTPLGMMLFEGVRDLPPDTLNQAAALLTPLLRLAHERLRGPLPTAETPSPAESEQETRWITRHNRLALALQRLGHLTEPLETLTVLADMMTQALDGNRIGILTIVDGRELLIHYRLGLTENILRLMPGLYRQELNREPSAFQGIVQVMDLQERPDELGAVARLQDVHTVLLLPMTIASNEVGLIVICRDQVRPFSPAELALGMTLASQSAIVLQKGYLYQQEHEQRELARSLSSAATALTQTIELERVLDLILQEVGRIVPGDACNVMLIEQGELRVVRTRGYAAFGVEEEMAHLRLPLTLPNIVRMMETRAPLLIPDVTQDPYWVPSEVSSWLRAYAGAPIVIGHDVVGFINVDSATPNAFSLEDAYQLKAFADYAAIALQNARYYAQARQQARDLSLLHTISEIFAHTTTLAESAQQCAAHLHKVFGATLTLVTYRTERSASLQAVGWSGMPPLTAETLAEALSELDTEALEPTPALLPPEVREGLPWPFPIGTTLQIPLISQEEKSGAVYLAWREARELSPDEVTLYMSLGREIGSGLERLHLLDELQRRQVYLERLNAAISEINQAVGQEAIAEAGLRQALRVEGVEQGALYLWTEGKEWRLRLHKNARGEVLPLPDSFPASRAPQISLPLAVGGELVGVMNLYGKGLRALHPDTEQLLQAIAYQLSLALQRGQLTDRLQEQLRAAHHLYELSAALLTLSLPAEAVQVMLRTMYDVLDPVISVGYYVPAPSGWMRERIYTTQKRNEWPRLWPEQVRAREDEQVLLDSCARTQQMVRATVFELPELLPALQPLGAAQVVYLPITLPTTQHHETGRVLGVAALVFKEERDLLSHESSLLASLLQQTAASVARLQLYHATREAESRLRAILESSQDGLVLIGTDLTVHYVNQAALRMLALPTEEATWEGRTLAEVIYRARYQAPALARWMLEQARTMPQTPHEAISATQEFATHDHRVLAVRRWGVFQDATTPLGCVFHLHDETERKALEQMRDDLLHMLVHDMRNPLGVILNAMMMLRDPALSGMEDELISITLHNTERTLRMVNTILDIGKLESGLTELRREQVALTRFLEPVEKIVRVSTREFSFEVDFPADLPPVDVEAEIIERVFQNLVDNALKFIAGSPARLRIAARAGDGVVQVEVFNTGKPIPPDTQTWLFEKFRPGKSGARGYGLGLAFCRLAVEAHGGKIWVENQPDGVSFYFTLPTAHAESA